MPVSPNAEIEISAFDWVPDFAKGLVRDLRVRWAVSLQNFPISLRINRAAKRAPPSRPRLAAQLSVFESKDAATA